MARGGITREDVRKARDAILVKGENPSIDSIRSELGNTGSKTTIHRFLKELEEEENTRLDDEALLSKTLKEMVSKIASRLHQEANSIVEEASALHQKQEKSWKELNDTKKQEITVAEQRIKTLEGQLTNSAGEISSLNTKLQETMTEVQRLNQKVGHYDVLLEEKNSQIDSLEEKHKHARETNDHYRSAAKEQRDQEQRRHEQQVQEIQAEQRQLKQTISIKLGEITQLNKENARLIEKEANNDKQIAALNTEANEMGEKLKAAESETISLAAQMSEKDKTIEKQSGIISSLESRGLEKEKRIKSLDIEIAETRAELKIKNNLFEKFELKTITKSNG